MPSGLWDFSYPMRDGICAALVEAEIPNHCISREIPNTWYVFSLLVYLLSLIYFLMKDFCCKEFIGFCKPQHESAIGIHMFFPC